MARIRLLAMDVDGTLLSPDGKITERTRAALRSAEEDRGVHLVLATGRRFHSAAPVARDLGVTTPVVVHNGALIKNLETKAVYRFHSLESDTARRLLELGKGFRADTIVLDDPEGDGCILTDGVSEANKALRRYLEINRQYVRPVDDLFQIVHRRVIQVMFCGPCGPMNELAELLMEELSESVRMLVTTYPKNDMTILDLVNPSASKGTAVEFLAEYFGVEREEVMAVGDNHNDTDMLRYAGRGVVMGNAEPELLNMGLHVTAPNTEDGLAQAVERFILS